MNIVAGRPALASTINFDDIAALPGDVILDSYQDFGWKNISVYTNTPGFPGLNSGIVSPANAAYTAGDTLGAPLIATISASTPFDFISGYFGAGWYDGLNVTVNGLYNGSQEFSQTFTVSTTGPQLQTFNFTGINELDIFSTLEPSTSDPYGCGPSGCSQVTLDDLTLNPGNAPPSSVTPEPISLLLSGVGFVALGVLLRRGSSRMPSL
jgi:hypothetical protein